MGKQEGGYWGSSGRCVKRRGEAETPSSAGGCISSFFHLFHFHPFHHFSFQHHLSPPSNAHPTTTTAIIPTKGTEAPRNSLESEDNSTMVVGSTISKQHQNLEIPKNNKLFIKTRTKGIISSSNIVNDMSPGTKTPTLVARLMGLDLLPPETLQSPSSSSPSSSSTTTTSSSCLSATKSKQVNSLQHLRPRQQNDVVITKARHSMDDRITASRFLPEAPPISSARRSDVEHRPSLHINKENILSEHSMELPRFSFSKLKFEDSGFNNISSRSPRQYAKQIVKQMRESVLSSRKVGSDITNTVQNNKREKKKQEGGGEFVVGPFMRSKKSPRTCSLSSSSSSDELVISSPGKISNNNNTPPSSCSPRLRFMNKSSSTMAKDNQPQAVSRVVLANNKLKPHEEAILVQQKQKSSSLPKCKKAANEKFSPQLKKQDKFVRNNKQHDSFGRPLLSSCSDKKSKRSSSHHHTLFINLLNTPPATKIPPHQKQTQVCDTREAKYCNTSQLSSGSSQTYKKEATTSLCIQRTTSTPTSGESNIDELDKRKIICESMFNNNNGPEFEYVSSILSRTDFPVTKGATNNTSSVSVSLFLQWLSPNPQPLHPSIFHLLEQQYYCSQNNHNQNNPTCDIFSFSSKDQNFRPYKYDLGVPCNRRLLFDLVDETLLEVVWPKEKVWERIIERFEKGNKKCEFLEDIDALIEMEEDIKKRVEGEEAIIMVAEIEGNIMDTLLHETVMMVTECCFCCWS